MNKINKELKIESLGFTNDLIFKQVMSTHIEICQELIRRVIPDADVSDIHYVKNEEEIIVGIKEKSVRFDIYAAGNNDRYRYNLEMYQYMPKNIEKTGRYNASMIDAQLKKAQKPADLSDVTVILLCTFDPFSFGEPLYEAKTVLVHHPEFVYNEGRSIYYLTNAGIDQAPDAIKPIIHLLKNDPDSFDDPFYQKIQDAVKEAKIDPEIRRKLMNEIEKEELWQEAQTKRILEEVTEKVTKEVTEEVTRVCRRDSIQTMLETLSSLQMPDEKIQAILYEKYPDEKDHIRSLFEQQP